MQIRGEHKSLITTRRLYLEAMKNQIAFILFLFIVLFINLLITVERERILELMGVLLVIYALAQFSEIPRLFRILGGMGILKTQERFLGFKFDEEMEKHQIYSTTYADENWFISAHPSSLIVFHRKYILNVSNVEEINFQWNPGRRDPSPRHRICKVTVTTINNEKLRIAGGRIELLNLKEWSHQ